MHDARNARLRGPSAWVAGKTHRASGRAVIRAIAGDDLVAAGEKARELEGVLVGIGAAVGEEECIDIAGSNFGELRAESRARFGSHERIRIGEPRRLLADRLNDALIAVSNVDGHKLAVEIDEALALRRVEVNALGAGDRNGIDFRLCRPFIERVLAGKIDDFGTGHLLCRGIRDGSGHNFPLGNYICSLTRRCFKTARVSSAFLLTSGSVVLSRSIATYRMAASSATSRSFIEPSIFHS